MNIRKTVVGALAAVMVCLSVSGAFAAQWQQTKTFKDKFGSDIEIEATYYAAEFVEKSTLEQAEKNLWTADEAEDYRYNLLQRLKLDKYIPIYIKIKNHGPAIHMTPFDRNVKLRLGKTRLDPASFDRRFNFKISDEREGFVYFPRFDEKGKTLLTPKVKTVRFTISSSISPVLNGKDIDFFWDVKDDNPASLMSGKAGARLEIERLTKRMSNLAQEGKDLQQKLDGIQTEMMDVNKRIMELQSLL